MSVAVTSLPGPLSPVMSTVLSLLVMTRRNSNTARIRALWPTTTDSVETGAGAIVTSEQPEVLEPRDLFSQRRFDAEIQRHVRARTAGAHACQLHVCRIAVDVDELDVAAVGLHERTYPIQHGFHTFSRDHVVRWGNRCATPDAPGT